MMGQEPRMMRVDPTKLDDDELERLVHLARQPSGKWFRRMLQGWVEVASAGLIESPSERLAGYTQALSDICVMLDRGGSEMQARLRYTAEPDDGADYWTEQ